MTNELKPYYIDDRGGLHPNKLYSHQAAIYLAADVDTEMEENHAIVGRLLDLDEKRQKAIAELRARIAELEAKQK